VPPDLFLVTDHPARGTSSHPEREAITAWLADHRVMTVAVYVRSQDIPRAWLRLPRDPLGMLPHNEFSIFSVGTADPWQTLAIELPGEDFNLPCRPPSSARPGSAAFTDPVTGGRLDPGHYPPPQPAFPDQLVSRSEDRYAGWVLCLAPEGPLEDVRVLTPGEADSSSLAFASTRTQPMGAWALLRQAEVIGWNGNYPAPADFSVIFTGDVWLSLASALSFSHDRLGNPEPVVRLSVLLDFAGRDALAADWEHMALSTLFPLSFCRDPELQECADFDLPVPETDTDRRPGDPRTVRVQPPPPGKRQRLEHRGWLDPFPSSLEQGTPFWVVLEDLSPGYTGSVPTRSPRSGPVLVWQMVVQDAHWPALTTQAVCAQTECLAVDAFYKRHLEDEVLWDSSHFDGQLPLIPAGERANGIRVLGIHSRTETGHFFGGGLHPFEPLPDRPRWPLEDQLWIMIDEPWIMIELESSGYSGLSLAAFTRLSDGRYTGGRTAPHTVFAFDSRWPAFHRFATPFFRRSTQRQAFVAAFPAAYPVDEFILIGDAGGPSGPAFVIP